MNVGFIGLGCEKNTVNTEMMIAACRNRGYQIVHELEKTQVVVINTCGFIESAKQEALETIFEVAQLKSEGKIEKIIVTGCLAERYQAEIAAEIPEADGFLGVGSFQRIGEAIDRVLAGERIEWFGPQSELQLEGDRVLTSPVYTSYLKIADGCSNRCAYCCIPAIRGAYKSRRMEAVLQEAEQLVAGGSRELILIAQDTTNYGMDLYGERRLPALIRAIAKIEGLHWLRLLYLYPEKISDELIALFASEPKLVPYIEMPVQHASGKILRAMRRPGDANSLLKLIEKLRARIPGVALRTTLIVGFPGETEEDFEELCRFVRAARFDKLGVFCYSREEGTPAYDLPDQIEQAVKERRRDVLETIQADIIEEKQAALTGRKLEVLAEGYDRFGECWYGRSYMEAPDIDGKIFFTGSGSIVPGQFVPVTIEDTLDFDLIGSIKEDCL
ncbi:MAG: 30S ribosomal protein S12 methylthiotransferase RimO [Clostridiales bacterium]|nr:MAG: 30S ribosomal protein S12 methylthiotransferase RimO [Clostridiales bacterium]